LGSDSGALELPVSIKGWCSPVGWPDDERLIKSEVNFTNVFFSAVDIQNIGSQTSTL
jgi:hypothetical protein